TAAPYGYAGSTAAPYGYQHNSYGYGYGNRGLQQAPYGMPQGTMMPTSAMMPPSSVPSGSFITPGGGNIVTLPAVEESYVENILRLNRGKLATFYMTY